VRVLLLQHPDPGHALPAMHFRARSRMTGPGRLSRCSICRAPST
jgi:hypothetical protein